MRELWDRIIQLLETAGGAIDDVQVKRGQYEQVVLRPPFVLVFVEPGTGGTIAGPGGDVAYTCTIFCAAAADPSGETADTVITAVEMAQVASTALRDLGPTFPEDPVVLDTVAADFSATRLTCYIQSF